MAVNNGSEQGPGGPHDDAAQAAAAPASPQAASQAAEVAERGADAGWPEPGEDADDDVDEKAATPVARPHGAPIWVAGLTVAGLVLVYLGERVLLSSTTGQWVATGLGVAMVLGATLLRFSPRFRGSGELRSIGRILATLSVVTLAALLLYFTTTDWVAERLGLSGLLPETRERLETVLTIGWIVLLASSLVPLLFGEAAMYPMRRAARPERRRVRAAVASGLALVLAAVYGSLFVYAADSAEVKADYSYFKTSRPSESTRKVAEALKEPVTVYAFFPPVNEARAEVAGYLHSLASGLKTLQVKLEDRFLVPKLARELGARQDGVIVLQRDKVKERLIIGIELKEARPKLRTLDRDFQQRLLKFVRSQRVAYLTTGHGELNDRPRQAGVPFEPAKGVKEIVRLLNYRMKDLGMAQGLAREVPDDADLVMILGPSEPFTTAEIDSLGRYAQQGGRLLIAFDPDAQPDSELGGPDEEAAEPEQPGGSAPERAATPPAARPGSSAQPGPKRPHRAARSAASAEPTPDRDAVPSLAAAPNPHEALAAVVGLKLDPTLLANERWYYPLRHSKSDRILLGTNRYSSHASVSTLSRNSKRLYALLLGAGSLETAPGSKAKVDFTLRSMPGTFADTNRDFEFERGTERSASFNLAAAVTQPVAKGARAKQPEAKKKQDKQDKKDKKPKQSADAGSAAENEMRAFVLADADGLATRVLAGYPPNQYLLADALRWLGGEESFAGEVSSEEDVRIEHTKQEDLVWFYSTIFGVPALVLAAGLVVARRSRRPSRGRSTRRTEGGAR
jgi:hypothetical protein